MDYVVDVFGYATQYEGVPQECQLADHLFQLLIRCLLNRLAGVTNHGYRGEPRLYARSELAPLAVARRAREVRPEAS